MDTYSIDLRNTMHAVVKCLHATCDSSLFFQLSVYRAISGIEVVGIATTLLKSCRQYCTYTDTSVGIVCIEIIMMSSI